MGVKISKKKSNKEWPEKVTLLLSMTTEPPKWLVTEAMAATLDRYNQLSEEGMLFEDWWNMGQNGIKAMYRAIELKSWSVLKAHMKSFWKVHG